jgi:hypothetical protein
MLEPNTYDGLLFVTAEGPPDTVCGVWGPKERDGPFACKHREDRVFRQAASPFLAAGEVLRSMGASAHVFKVTGKMPAL